MVCVASTREQGRVSMKRLDDKVILITGGSSGLGAAAAVLLARDGAKVALAARRRDKSEAVLHEIGKADGDALFIQTDVTDSGAVKAMVEKTVAHFGRLDCAVNNAGISGPTLTPVAEIDEAGWDATLNTNLKAVFMCMKYEIPAMLRHGKGSIVNISSIYGYKPSDLGHAPYAVSKHGVIALTKSAAIDYAGRGIRVNAVCPGFTHSEMVDPYVDAEAALMGAVIRRHSSMNRLGGADEIAEAIAFLCSDASSFVNGAALTADGGETPKLY